MRDTNGATGQALAEATSQAMTKARAVAQAMGGRVLRVVEEQEQGNSAQAYADSDAREFQGGLSTRTTTTPIRVGPLTISSRVQVIVEVEARP